ncbi:MAG: hypothetical protein AAF871_14230 [Pseudomonadota bacterium]
MRTLAAFLLAGFLATPAGAADRVIVRGDLGYEAQRLTSLQSGTEIDLGSALFRVGISRNPAPTALRGCDVGRGDINRYPFAIEASPEVRILGGRFDGEAPLGSDWIHTYCNSSAIRLETSPGATVRQARLRRVWDGIRIDPGSDAFSIARVWMSEVRDDCVENDHLHQGVIRDSLFDGCFAGISIAPISKTQSQGELRLERVLLRMEEYSYRGAPRHALPIKVKVPGQKLVIRDTIFAVSTSNAVGGEHIETMWGSIARCSGNRLLWLGDGPLPDLWRGAPACFEIVEGAAAADQWDEAVAQWRDNNRDAPRFDSDQGA